MPARRGHHAPLQRSGRRHARRSRSPPPLPPPPGPAGSAAHGAGAEAAPPPGREGALGLSRPFLPRPRGHVGVVVRPVLLRRCCLKEQLSRPQARKVPSAYRKSCLCRGLEMPWGRQTGDQTERVSSLSGRSTCLERQLGFGLTRCALSGVKARRRGGR